VFGGVTVCIVIQKRSRYTLWCTARSQWSLSIPFRWTILVTNQQLNTIEHKLEHNWTHLNTLEHTWTHLKQTRTQLNTNNWIQLNTNLQLSTIIGTSRINCWNPEHAHVRPLYFTSRPRTFNLNGPGNWTSRFLFCTPLCQHEESPFSAPSRLFPWALRVSCTHVMMSAIFCNRESSDSFLWAFSVSSVDLMMV
jgi:uncharacterized protein YbdZ (MbtH family)